MVVAQNVYTAYTGGVTRLDMAINALNAVRDLLTEASTPTATLCHVGADNLACLLGMILGEMNLAREDIGEIIPG